MTSGVATPSGTTTQRPGGDQFPVAILAGSLAWLLGTLQYFVAQLVAAGAWHPPYSWTRNYISDLGNTVCGQFAVPHGTAMYVCSPRHALMNSSFIVAGVLFVAGVVLLRRVWPSGSLARRAFLLLITAGIGKALVGLAPENVNVGLHLLGSLNVPLVSIAILMLSATIWRTNRAWSTVGAALGLIGLVGTTLSTLGQFAGTSFYLGLGVGGMERVATYPASIWILAVAIAALARRGVFA